VVQTTAERLSGVARLAPRQSEDWCSPSSTKQRRWHMRHWSTRFQRDFAGRDGLSAFLPGLSIHPPKQEMLARYFLLLAVCMLRHLLLLLAFRSAGQLWVALGCCACGPHPSDFLQLFGTRGMLTCKRSFVTRIVRGWDCSSAFLLGVWNYTPGQETQQCGSSYL